MQASTGASAETYFTYFGEGDDLPPHAFQLCRFLIQIGGGGSSPSPFVCSFLLRGSFMSGGARRVGTRRIKGSERRGGRASRFLRLSRPPSQPQSELPPPQTAGSERPAEAIGCFKGIDLMSDATVGQLPSSPRVLIRPALTHHCPFRAPGASIKTGQGPTTLDAVWLPGGHSRPRVNRRAG